MTNKYKLLLIGITILVVLTALLLIFLLSNIKPSETSDDISPTLVPRAKTPLHTVVVPKDILTAPTYPPDKGSGIDMEAQPIKTSIQEIEKLAPFLPYDMDVTLQDGRTISILIPPKNLQNNPWTLTVQLFAIDYNLESEKAAFREAAGEVFAWLRQHDVNPANIYISWGEKAYMQDQAEKWLKAN